MPDTGKLVELTSLIVGAMVNEPRRVSVRATVVGDRTVISVKVAPEDLALVLGRQGRTVEALRVVLMPITRRLGVHLFDLDVERPSLVPLDEWSECGGARQRAPQGRTLTGRAAGRPR
jgi:uncharacterized protein